jgi:arginase
VNLSLILVPYDLGREDVGSGRGPQAYVEAGAAATLRSLGHHVKVATAQRRGPFRDELEAVIDVNQALADLVAEAVRHRRLPLVIAGNCNAALGAGAGLQAALPAQEGQHLALVWLDAHGDFNTPATSRTSYLDGMPLAMATGRAHPQARARLGGDPLAERFVLHAGGRDLDPEEEAALAGSAALVVTGADLREKGVSAALRPALDELAERAGEELADLPPVHLHIDIDVLDPSAAPSVTFPSPGGLTLPEILTVLEMVATRFRVRALTLTSFAPAGAGDATTCATGTAILLMVAGAA